MPLSASPRRPLVLIGAFVALTVGCVLGLVTWKSVTSRDAALSRNEADIKNLGHSLAQHAMHTFKAPEIAMTGMADLLKFQNPLPQRFNAYLANTVRSLPQLREMGVLNAAGNWRYSSLDQLPTHNNADRDYFVRHRDNADPKLLITGPMISRLTGRSTLLLSKRISDPEGEFAGVLVAAIDYDAFSKFYASFDIGSQGSICLISADGTILVRWPSGTGRNVSDTELFQTRLKESPVGFYRIVSPFDGVAKYFGYEVTPEYSMVVTVARSESEVLGDWRADLKRDLLVAAVLMTVMAGMAWLLARQFGVRMRLARRYRLLAENSADIVILLDCKGRLLYVSHSVNQTLGYTENELVGRSCLDVVHDDDKDKIIGASAGPSDPADSRSVVFRTKRKDGRFVWLESNFKLAEESADGAREIVGVLRDVTKRKELEDELSEANARLSRLATTDGLTRLANRRHFDMFVREAFAQYAVLSVLLIDIDHFKGFNDALGHQAGDACLQRISQVIDGSTASTNGLSARYGGEEFAVVLPGVAEEQALTVANALRLMVRQLGIQHPRASRGYVTVSIGVAAKTATTIDEVALIRDADVALYNAKELGRNRSFGPGLLTPSDRPPQRVRRAMEHHHVPPLKSPRRQLRRRRVDVASFTQFYRRLGIGPNGSVSPLNADGIILAGTPTRMRLHRAQHVWVSPRRENIAATFAYLAVTTTNLRLLRTAWNHGHRMQINTCQASPPMLTERPRYRVSMHPFRNFLPGSGAARLGSVRAPRRHQN